MKQIFILFYFSVQKNNTRNVRDMKDYGRFYDFYLQQKQDDKKVNKKEEKDSRNLYLAREGLVREGTKAAIGVSKADLQLRTSLGMVSNKMSIVIIFDQKHI